MSINDQVAGLEPVAFLRCEKIQSTEFLNKPGVILHKSLLVEEFFLKFCDFFFYSTR